MATGAVNEIRESPVARNTQEIAQDVPPSTEGSSSAPRIIRSGYTTMSGEPAVIGPALAQNKPNTKGQVTNPFSATSPAPNLYSGYTSFAGTSLPATQKPSHTRSNNDAVARTVERIIAAVNDEITKKLLPQNPNNSERGTEPEDAPDEWRPGYSEVALDCLNRAYKRARRQVKQQLLNHPNAQDIFTTAVTAAISQAKIGPTHSILDAFIALSTSMFAVEPAVSEAFLKRALEGNELTKMLSDSLPPEGQKALGDFIDEIKGLPFQLQLSLLNEIAKSPDNSKRVIDTLTKLIKKQWFLNPSVENCKIASPTQLQFRFIALFGFASRDGDMQDTLDYILNSEGPEVVWCEFKKMDKDYKNADGMYYRGVISVNWTQSIEIIAQIILRHEGAHAKRKDDLSQPNSVRRFEGELIGWIEGFKGQHKRMPSLKETFLRITDDFLGGDVYGDIKNAFNAETTQGLIIARRIGELIGLENATPDDIRMFNLALRQRLRQGETYFRRGWAYLSTEPLSQKAIDDWLSLSTTTPIPPRSGDEALKAFFYDPRLSEALKK